MAYRPLCSTTARRLSGAYTALEIQDLERELRNVPPLNWPLTCGRWDMHEFGEAGLGGMIERK